MHKHQTRHRHIGQGHGGPDHYSARNFECFQNDDYVDNDDDERKEEEIREKRNRTYGRNLE